MAALGFVLEDLFPGFRLPGAVVVGTALLIQQHVPIAEIACEVVEILEVDFCWYIEVDREASKIDWMCCKANLSQVRLFDISSKCIKSQVLRIESQIKIQRSISAVLCKQSIREAIFAFSNEVCARSVSAAKLEVVYEGKGIC